MTSPNRADSIGALLRALLAILTLTLSLGTDAPAQLVFDESYLVSHEQGLLALDRRTGAVSTVLRVNPVARIVAVTMNHGNHSAIAVVQVGGTSTELLKITPTTTSRLLSRGVLGTDAVLDQTGQWLVPAGRTVLRTSVSGSQFSLTTFIPSLGGNAVAVCRNDDDGTILVATDEPALVRFSVRGLAPTTLTALTVRAIDHDQRSGTFYAVTPNDVVRIDKSGVVLDRRPLVDGVDVRIDDVAGRLHVATERSVEEWDLQMNTLRAFPISAGRVTGFERWGRLKLAPAPVDVRRGGEMVRVNGSFPTSPNAGYVVGISVGGLRPGFALGDGRVVNIVPDRLFLTSVSTGLPIFTSDFTGVADSDGGFSARFFLPNFTAPVSRIHCVAAVIDRTKPGNVDVSETVTVRAP